MVAALLLVLALAEAARGLDPVRVHPPTQEFVDTLGRVRYFRGLNAVSKMPPFVPVQDRFDPRNSISEEDAKNLEKWGFNVIRLGVMWSAVEPELGFFNTTYLASMREVVQRLARHGVYTIIDAHQDAMSRRFCGEGFPDFAVKPSRATQGPLLKFPRPFFYDLPTDPATGFPALDKCQEHQFFQYYLTFECSSAWINFYEDQALHREFARSWEHVAAAFNDTEGVLGYELLNEPWLGDFWTNPGDALSAGRTDRAYLAPLYRTLHEHIRRVDDQCIIFYEPSVHESYLMQPVGFEEGPGGRAYDDRQALAYHIYCHAQNATGDPRSVEDCTKSLGPLWSRAQQDWRRIGGGSFLTEFGALGPHETSAEVISFMADEAEVRGQSWTYWTWKSFHDITTQNPATETLYNSDGTLQHAKLHALSRTWSHAVTGFPGHVHQRFDAATGRFNLTYLARPHVSAPTELHLGAGYYPKGVNIYIMPHHAATARREAEVLYVTHTPDVVNSSKPMWLTLLVTAMH